MQEVSENIEKIKSIFLNTQLFYATNGSMKSLLEYLEKIPATFRSIAYESASMSIALKGFENSMDTTEWQSFANGPAKAHQAQLYIGLGWAIAKLNLPFLSIVEKLDPLLHFRVADGCGYYDGSFRQRQSVMSQQLPAYLPVAILSLYDEGLGRSLLYSCNADIDKIKKTIETFSAKRQAALWRGMGIAVGYVGGCTDKLLKNIFDYAGEHGVQLACGAALAAKSRMDANSMTTDTDRCSRLWFTLAGEAVKMFSVIPEDVATNYDREDFYNCWIKQIEEGLTERFRAENNL